MEKLISWVEIPSVNIEKSTAFFNTVFKLSLHIADYGSEKTAYFPCGQGAISQAHGFEPSGKGTMASFTVPDTIEATLQRATENGGEIIKGKTKIDAENAGYFAIISDIDGNSIGLHQKN